MAAVLGDGTFGCPFSDCFGGCGREASDTDELASDTSTLCFGASGFVDDVVEGFAAVAFSSWSTVETDEMEREVMGRRRSFLDRLW